MSKQNIIIIAAVVLAATLGGVYFWLSQSGNLKEVFNGPSEEEAESSTRFEVPADIKVPEKGEEVGGDVATPQLVVPSRQGSETNLRVFNIEGRGNEFVPSEVIVYRGDIVRINFIALDKDYDFIIPDYGFRKVIAKGEKDAVEFQATDEGKYVYYCEVCGGLDSSAKGYITIVPR